MLKPDEFFEAPRSWSILKYKILDKYLSQYFPKVNQKYMSPAVVADLFAGKGKFDDGSEGSATIISKHAKRYKDRLGYSNQVVLSDQDPRNCAELSINLKEYVDENIVRIIPGDATDVGQLLLGAIKPGVPLFVLLDPCGIKGLSMDLLLQIFKRAKADSTEVLINFNHRAIYRLAGICKNINSKNVTEKRQAVSIMKIFSQTFGGDWWLQIIMDEQLPEKLKAQKLQEQYIAILRDNFKWIGFLPVTRGMPDESVKYYLVFASQSAVAFELMNDVMKKSWDEMIKEIINKQNVGTLFEGEDASRFVPVRFRIQIGVMAQMVLNEIRAIVKSEASYVGNPYNVIVHRPQLRYQLISRRFGRYTSSEYNEAVKILLQKGIIVAETEKARISDPIGFKLKPDFS